MYDWDNNGDTATIHDGPTGWFGVEYAYDPELKDMLKHVAGRGNYRYQPASKRWLFRTRYFDEIIAALESWDYDVSDERHTHKRQRSQPPPNNHQSTPATENPWEVIFRALSSEQQSALYRAALKTVHPDVGGSNDITRLLIQAWEHINA